MGIGGKPGASLRAFRDYLKIQIYDRRSIIYKLNACINTNL
jgi:hypothetical protein